MQTFLPYPEIKKTVNCLDKKRLWKQALEARELWQILAQGKESHWKNHPACLMWKGFENGLALYYNECLGRCLEIGIKTKLEFIEHGINEFPFWFGGPIHKTHCIALLTKNFEYYKQFGWEEKPNENYKYFWPVIKCIHCYGTGYDICELDSIKCSYCRGSGVQLCQ